MEDLITIIIPIYNAEKHLKRCLDSIQNQSYTNLEVLLLNDGSQDQSEKICHDYTSDTRFQFIDKQNSGVADTRNYGLERATGKYVMFVDSDDYIHNNHYIEDLLKRMQLDHTQMVLAGMSHIRNGKVIKKEYYTKNNTILTFEEVEEKFITTNYFNACYRSLISREMIGDTRFQTHLRYAEDLLFMHEVMKNVGRFSYLFNCDYCYLQDSDSAINNNNMDKQLKYLDNTLEVLNTIARDNIPLQKIVKTRLHEKYNYALKRLCIGKSYQEFKQDYQKLSEIYFFGKYDFSKSNESVANKIRLYLLNKNNIVTYYYFNRLLRLIK